MLLEQSYDKKEDIPDNIVGMYEEKDGKFILSHIDGLTSKKELDDFRQNNLEAKRNHEAIKKELSDTKTKNDEDQKILQDKIDEIQAQFSGVDLNEIAAMRAKQKELDDKKTMLMPDVEKLIQERVANANKTSEDNHKKILATNDTETKDLRDIIKLKQDRLYKEKITNKTQMVSQKIGLLPGAVTDVTGRILGVFSLDDNDNVVGKNNDGTVMYQKDNVTPVNIESFMNDLKTNEDSKHLFVQSSGANPLGGGGTPTTSDRDYAKTSSVDDIAIGIEKNFK